MNLCPYVGKLDDPNTPILYPTEYNACYRSIPARTPELAYQDAYCLTPNCAQCPAFTDKSKISAVPFIRLPTPARKSARKLWLTLVLIDLAVLALAALVWLLFFRGASGKQGLDQPPPPPATAAPVVSDSTATPAVDAWLLTTALATSSPSSPTAAPTATPTPMPPVGLETPFGGDIKFLIHRLKAGDSLTKLTNTYLTSVEAIKWINAELEIPLLVDRLVVIPLGAYEVDPKTPPFTTYQVSGGQITVEDLAEQLSVDVNLLRYYNGIQPGQILARGCWVIVPVARR